MVRPDTPDSPASRLRMGVGFVFLSLGLLGHLYAAYAIGGGRVAFTHHVLLSRLYGNQRPRGEYVA